jgi:hypothetical protein
MVETLKEALLDLYLDVKVRSNQEVRAHKIQLQICSLAVWMILSSSKKE